MSVARQSQQGSATPHNHDKPLSEVEKRKAEEEVHRFWESLDPDSPLKSVAYSAGTVNRAPAPDRALAPLTVHPLASMIPSVQLDPTGALTQAVPLPVVGTQSSFGKFRLNNGGESSKFRSPCNCHINADTPEREKRHWDHDCPQNPDRQVYPCPQCGKELTRHDRLLRHVRDVHGPKNQ